MIAADLLEMYPLHQGNDFPAHQCFQGKNIERINPKRNDGLLAQAKKSCQGMNNHNIALALRAR